MLYSTCFMLIRYYVKGRRDIRRWMCVAFTNVNIAMQVFYYALSRLYIYIVILMYIQKAWYYSRCKHMDNLYIAIFYSY